MYLDVQKPRQKDLFSFDWQFHFGDLDSETISNVNTAEYRNVQLPHDWSIEFPFDENASTCGSGGYVTAGIGWYRKTFQIAPHNKGKKIYIQFDGAYMHTEVWLNGFYLGLHVYGYTPFEYDITDKINYDSENVINVRLDNSHQPGSRWYSGSGITRDIWLTAVQPLHISTYGTYICTPEISEKKATVTIETTMSKIAKDENSNANLHTIILDAQGKTVASDSVRLQTLPKNKCMQTLTVSDPKLWSDKNPYLYKSISRIESDDKLIDEYETRFGIRSIDFNCDNGFILNGEQVKINGVCIHHDGGCLGAAVPKKVWERRLLKLKEMGVNGLRMSHNPPDSGLLDLCDEIGFLVMDEAFDEWEILKGKELGSNTHESRGYSEWFKEYHEYDIKAMLYRDRNHPSIIIWSIGNEVPEQTAPDGHVLAKHLIDICHEVDPTRLTTQANDQICAEPKKATDEFLDVLDVVGYNYTGRWRTRAETLYADDKKADPSRIVIGTENPSAAGKRGDYDNRPSNHFWRRNYFSAPVGAEKLLRFTMTHQYVAGDFMWTGIDYLGEAHWPDRSSSSGVLDTCGFPKDHFYFYKSIWNRQDPMIHAFPSWNLDRPEGEIVPVLCYTNCDSAELFLNGKSYGKKSYGYPIYGMTETYGHFDVPQTARTTDDMFLSWDVPYYQGTLKVVGYNLQGETISTYETRTAEKSAKIDAQADTETMIADGRDITHIEVKILDNNDMFVSNANEQLSVKINGPARLIGLDNGQPDSHESFKGSCMNTFNGMLLIIIQSEKNNPGNISIEISGKNIKPETIKLSSKV